MRPAEEKISEELSETVIHLYSYAALLKLTMVLHNDSISEEIVSNVSYESFYLMDCFIIF